MEVIDTEPQNAIFTDTLSEYYSTLIQNILQQTFTDTAGSVAQGNEHNIYYSLWNNLDKNNKLRILSTDITSGMYNKITNLQVPH